MILTAVEKVCVNFNTPEQADHRRDGPCPRPDEYIAQGQFAPGSMLPKVEACIEYVEAYPEGKALITSLECAAAGLRGETGTVITANYGNDLQAKGRLRQKEPPLFMQEFRLVRVMGGRKGPLAA